MYIDLVVKNNNLRWETNISLGMLWSKDLLQDGYSNLQKSERGGSREYGESWDKQHNTSFMGRVTTALHRLHFGSAELILVESYFE